MHLQSKESRLLDRTYDDTSLHVVADTRYLALVVELGIAKRLKVGREVLLIVGKALVVNVVESESDAQIHTVVDVAAQIEVVFTDIAFGMAVEHIIVGIQIVVFTIIGVEVQALVYEFIHLTIGGRIGSGEGGLVFARCALVAELSGADTARIGEYLL